jgi:hypothetical protein
LADRSHGGLFGRPNESKKLETDCLKGKHQADGWRRGMRVLIEFEAGQFEIGNLVYKTPILGAQEKVL